MKRGHSVIRTEGGSPSGPTALQLRLPAFVYTADLGPCSMHCSYVCANNGVSRVRLCVSEVKGVDVELALPLVGGQVVPTRHI